MKRLKDSRRPIMDGGWAGDGRWEIEGGQKGKMGGTTRRGMVICHDVQVQGSSSQAGSQVGSQAGPQTEAGKERQKATDLCRSG
jgi:hypothetical protein